MCKSHGILVTLPLNYLALLTATIKLEQEEKEEIDIFGYLSYLTVVL